MSKSADTPPEQSISVRPDELLSGIAADAWQAYNAMETTKRRHFGLLQILDNKKKNYNIDPTEQDQHLLSALLRDHDEQVRRFTLASQSLKDQDRAAHLALFGYIAAIGKATDDQQVMH